MSNEQTKIAAVTVENFMKVKFARIDFTNNRVVMTGENGAGKSSFARALLMGFTGKKAVPADPVNHGAEEARVTIELVDDLVIVGTVQPDRSYELELRDKEGGLHRKAQQRLDAFNFNYSYFPQQFITANPRDRIDMSMEAMGIDPGPLDRKRAKAFDDRTEKNREVARLTGTLESRPERHKDVPEQETPSATLIIRLNDARVVVEQQAAKKREVAQLLIENEQRRASVIEWEKQIAVLKAKIEDTNSRFEMAADEAAKLALEAEQMDLPDIATIESEFATLETTNRKVRENKERASLEAELVAAEKESLELSDKIKAIDAEKEQLVRDAKFPVEGLSFGEDDIMLDGFPFDQASEAERWACAIAIGIARKPMLQFIYISHGALMTPETRQRVYALAEKHDVQLLVEVPGEADDATVIMVDGFSREIVQGGFGGPEIDQFVNELDQAAHEASRE